MTTSDLTWAVFPLDVHSFHRTPILLSGAHDAILVDGGFTISSGHLLAARIKAAGKKLREIFVTCADPDYYFGLGPIRDAFPDVKVWASPETAAVIAATVAYKVAVWSPRLGDDGPRTVHDAVIPTAYTSSELHLDGVAIEIVAARQPNRFHLWVPSLKAILGGVQVVSGIHVWMADTPTADERTAWVDSLQDMIDLHPQVVVPGHMAPGSAMGVEALVFTQRYLKSFESELSQAQDAAALITAMKAHYPDLAMDFVLELGAKVCKGEASWP